MNYNHGYHAGNFADVFKHCVLVLLVQFLCKKDKPFLYLDTHAGIASYDLTVEVAQKTREYEDGIVRLVNYADRAGALRRVCDRRHDVPLVVNMYLDIIRAFNKPGDKIELNAGIAIAGASKMVPRYYPGSPSIAQVLLRQQDRILLTELHRDYVRLLKREFFSDRRVSVHHLDGYQSMKAFLPPPEWRALVLIDPPFEEKDEFNRILESLQVAQQRFPSGVYMVWYPIKDLLSVKNFYWALKKRAFKNILIAELSVGDKNRIVKKVANDRYGSSNSDRNESELRQKLLSCGLIILNAPWQFEQQLKPLVSWLSDVLSQEVNDDAKNDQKVKQRAIVKVLVD